MAKRKRKTRKITAGKSYGLFKIKDVIFNARPIVGRERNELEVVGGVELSAPDSLMLRLLNARIAKGKKKLPDTFLHDITPMQYGLISTVLTRPDAIKIKTKDGYLTDQQPIVGYEDELEVVSIDEVSVTFMGIPIMIGETTKAPDMVDGQTTSDYEKTVIKHFETQFVEIFMKRVSKQDLDKLEQAYKQYLEEDTVDIAAAILHWWNGLDGKTQEDTRNFMASPELLTTDNETDENDPNA